MVKRRRIIKRIRHVIRRIAAGRAPLRKKKKTPAPLIMPPARPLSDLPQMTADEYHPRKKITSDHDSGWRKT
jgi:hypothetical protein